MILAQLISYEEYYPYGSTSYQAVDASIKVAGKRYRYTAMERDGENGLEYHSARYYVPWLARWASADPSGVKAAPNLYLYVNANPLIASDPSGREDKQLWLMEQTKFMKINPIATRVARGITSVQRLALRVLDTWFGPQIGLDWAHPKGQPFNTQPAGTQVPLHPEHRPENSSGQHEGKVAGKDAEAAGGFRRRWDGNHSVDTTVPAKTRFKQPPHEPHLKALAPAGKNLPKRLSATATPPTPKPPVKTPSAQLELPVEHGGTPSPGPKGFEKARGGLAANEMLPKGLRIPPKVLSIAEGLSFLPMAAEYFRTGGITFGTLPDGEEIGLGMHTVRTQVGTTQANMPWIMVSGAQQLIDAGSLHEGDYFADVTPMLRGDGPPVLCLVLDGKPYVTGYTYRADENIFVGPGYDRDIA